jgi:hypothetical protein
VKILRFTVPLLRFVIPIDRLQPGKSVHPKGPRQTAPTQKSPSIPPQTLLRLIRIETPLETLLPNKPKPSPTHAARISGSELGRVLAADAYARMNVPRVGRNDPCPCGSGRKYKKCHGA